MEREADGKRQEEMNKQEDLKSNLEAERQIGAGRVKMEKRLSKDKPYVCIEMESKKRDRAKY